MPVDHHPSRRRLRACVEELVAAAPAGITTGRLRDEVSRRVHPTGGPTRVPVSILPILGQLLVEGRIDERDGVWMTHAQSSAISQPLHRRQAA